MLWRERAKVRGMLVESSTPAARGSETAVTLLPGRSMGSRRLSRGVGARGRERLGGRPAGDRRGCRAFIPGSSQPEGKHAAAAAPPAREPSAVPAPIAGFRRRHTPGEQESENRPHEADARHQRAGPLRRHRGSADGSAPRPIAACPPAGETAARPRSGAGGPGERGKRRLGSTLGAQPLPGRRSPARAAVARRLLTTAAIPGTSTAGCRGRPRPRRASLPPGRP